MDLLTFVKQLRQSGRVTVTNADPDDTRLPDEFLAEIDTHARSELLPGAPPLDTEAAHWGARFLYGGCRLLVNRELGEDDFEHVLGPAWTRDMTESAVYSCDLVLRYLPGLIVMLRARSQGDPLITRLLDEGNRWPLSSVGISGALPDSIDAFWGNPALRQLYVDRIFQSQDVTRLADERAALEAAAVLGGHPELCPILAAHLRTRHLLPDL